MRSGPEKVPARRRPPIHRERPRLGQRPALKIVLTLLLVIASLAFVAAADLAAGGSSSSSAALAQETGQNTPGATEETGEPPPEGSGTDTPETPPDDTPTAEPEPPDDTAEPAPSETPEPPPKTIEPTPGEPAATAEGTPGAEDTAEPVTTEPARTEEATTATASPTPTATDATGRDLPLGTIRFGAEEEGPPAEPIQVTLVEWFRLALALIVVALVAVLGGRVLYRLLLRAIKRQNPDVDEALLVHVRPLLSWWLAAIAFHIAVLWVGFENAPARELSVDLAFLLYVGVAALTAWRLVDHAIDLYANRVAAEGNAEHIEKLRPIMRRWARALILLLAALIGLGRLDIGFSVSALLVMAIALTVMLAARDTVADIVAGFSILIDQPFRIGDRIEVEGVDTWADVVSIGLRATTLRTRHNVEVIVPNSTIGKGQVINYSYPDSRFRMQTQVGIAFGTDVEYARQTLIDAVRKADLVLPYEPIDALYVEIGDSDMVFRVRWWIDFYQDWEEALDYVNTALHNALAEAGIDSPYPSQSLNVQVDDQTLAEVWQAWQEEG